MMRHIRGILFDKDGTLFDFQMSWSSWARSFLNELAGEDAQRAQALGDAIGFDIRTGVFTPDSPVIAGTPREISLCLLPLLPGATPAALVTRMNSVAALAPMQPATPLLPLLGLLRANGLKLGVVTNDAEAPARAHLAAAGIADYFDFIAGCDSGHGAKPAPGQLYAFADSQGLDPTSVLMVGDSRHDMIAGRAAGMGTIGVLTGLAVADDLHDVADMILPDIGHLPDYLTSRAA